LTENLILSESIFEGNKNLRNVTFSQYFGNSIPPYSFRDCPSLTSITISSIQFINNKTLTIYNVVQFIGDFAFYGIKNDQKVVFVSNSLLRLEHASLGFFDLETVQFTTFPKFISLNNDANPFTNCYLICNVILSDNFSCSVLESISFSQLFGDTPIASLDLYNLNCLVDPDFECDSNFPTVWNLQRYNFQNSEVSFPLKIVSILDHAFSDNQVLTNITFESGSKLKNVGWNAFEWSIIIYITFPSSFFQFIR
jgi:hypothetical protein